MTDSDDLMTTTPGTNNRPIHSRRKCGSTIPHLMCRLKLHGKCRPNIHNNVVHFRFKNGRLSTYSNRLPFLKLVFTVVNCDYEHVNVTLLS